MRYAIIDVEATEPLPDVALAHDETGVAVLVRKSDAPVHFALHQLPRGSRLTPTELGRLISASGALDLLETSTREIFAVPVDTVGVAPPTTVAICTRDRPELLADCLSSLADVTQRHDRQDRPEVLVVDNAPSSTATEDVVGTFPGVRHVVEPRPGLDFARNRAVSAAGGEWIAFLDDDVVVDRGWFGGLRRAMACDPDAAAVTGLVLPAELNSRAQVIFERRGGFRRGFRTIRYAGPRTPENRLYPLGAGIFGAGCNMAFRRDVLRQLGGFDEALDTGRPLPGGGDLDMFYRVVRAGFPLVYEPRFLVFHKHRASYQDLRRQYWTWGTGFMAFVSKTYRTDATQRPDLRRLVRWRLQGLGRELRRSLGSRDGHPPDLVAAELLGAVAGLAGAYPRSVKRTRRIRQRAA